MHQGNRPHGRFLIFLLAIIYLAGLAGQNPSPVPPAARERGMVSSAHPLAIQSGVEILKKGGNAFDAAVAVAAVLNVVEPAVSGMGGYGTILVYTAADRIIRFLLPFFIDDLIAHPFGRHRVLSQDETAPVPGHAALIGQMSHRSRCFLFFFLFPVKLSPAAAIFLGERQRRLTFSRPDSS